MADDAGMVTGDATTSQPDRPADQSTNESSLLVTDGFEPEYDAAEVLRRVERLRGLRVTERIVVHEYADVNRTVADLPDRFAGIRPSGAEALQLYSNAPAERELPLGYTVESNDAVHVYLMNASDLAAYGLPQDVVLAHELVHAVQFQHRLISPSRAGFESQFRRWTTDNHLVATALVEGDAMRVTKRYHDRYAAGDYAVDDYNRTASRAAWPTTLSGTPYYYGSEFYRARNASAEMRSRLIRRPPNTTAELLHPGETRTVAPLPPAPSIGETLTRYDTDRVGELTIRHALRINDLSFSRAAAAADGWANDRMYYYERERMAVHWITVWENESEATEFAEAWRAMLATRNATEVKGTTYVPATETTLDTYYVIVREGSTVRLTAAGTQSLALRMARNASQDSSSSRIPSSSSSISASSTSVTA